MELYARARRFVYALKNALVTDSMNLMFLRYSFEFFQHLIKYSKVRCKNCVIFSSVIRLFKVDTLYC